MATFSFDIVSEIDKAEMNNVYLATEKEISSRFDFKSTPANIEWMDDKKGFKLTGSNDWQIEAIIDIVRKKLATRNQSSKVLDLSKPVNEANLKATKEVPFNEGLNQEKAKLVSKTIRENHPKLKNQIIGESVRVTGQSKDELQAVMNTINALDLDAPIKYTNYR